MYFPNQVQQCHSSFVERWYLLGYKVITMQSHVIRRNAGQESDLSIRKSNLNLWLYCFPIHVNIIHNLTYLPNVLLQKWQTY